MNAAGHYLKPAGRSYAPGQVFSVTADVQDVESRSTGQYRESVLRRCYACVSTKIRGRWTRPTVSIFGSGDDLRRYIHDSSSKSRRNYIICPIASDVLTLTNFWRFARETGTLFITQKQRSALARDFIDTGENLDIRRLVLRGSPDILDYTYRRKRYVWLSARQYTDSTPILLAESIGFEWETRVDDNGINLSLEYDGYNLCLLYSLYFCKLANWWSDNATAPFGFTVGQLAMGVLRSNVPAKTLCTHTASEVHRIERAACYGGRASVWYVGNVGDGVPSSPDGRQPEGQRALPRIRSDLSQIDIRSMYPTLLRDKLFPVSLESAYGEMLPDDARELAERKGVIASVFIHSESGEYPLRIGDRVEYPRGYFHTTLAGPEILSLSGRDRLIKVHNAAIYKLGTPFKVASEKLLALRRRSEGSGDTSTALFCKALAVSLGGKLAQRKGEWTECRDTLAEREWGEWLEHDCDTDSTARYRAIAGCVSKYTKDATGEGPYTFAFAYLTSYGRVMMRKIREALPTETVVSQDTDGIWVLGKPDELKQCSACSWGESPGDARVKYTVRNARFFGARHYYTDLGWVLAGFHQPSVSLETYEISDSWAENPVIRGVRDVTDRLITQNRVSKLTIDLPGCEVDRFGWVHPRYIDTQYREEA